MATTNNILAKNIQKQLALNAGQLTIQSVNGSYSFYDSTSGTQILGGGNASNYVASNVPAVYPSAVRAEVYNYAKGIFGGQNIPQELVESLSSLATYYVSQTGVNVQTLFKNGQLQGQFLATINGFLNKSLQFGYQSLNTKPAWANNPVLHGNISAALQPSLR